MGERGPAPKRDEERRRRNKPEVETITVDYEFLSGQQVEVPAPDDSWHPLAYQWYIGLTNSLQSRFYEPSDWALAQVLAEQLSRELKPKFVGMTTGADGSQEPLIQRVPLAGSSLASILKGMTALLVTEADRRRLSIEVNRPDLGEGEEATPATVTDIREGLLG